MTKYWENLGLNFDPFDPNEDIEPCFLSEPWLYLLDLILELSCHSHAVLLVVGPSGGGKSTLVKAFANRLEMNGVCQIRGDQSITVDFLRYLLAKHLGIAYAENQLEQFNRQLANQLEQMAKNRQQFHIVIDDAHLLPERTLAGLLTLAARQPHEFPPLHMVFFGSLPLETTLTDILARYHLDVITHTTRIKSFDINATKDYIDHCLKSAGHTGDFPLIDTELEQIYMDSEGLPGSINQHVVGYLNQRRLGHRSIPAVLDKLISKPKWQFTSRQLISGIGLFALIAMAFLVVNHPTELSANAEPRVATAEASLPALLDDPVQNDLTENEKFYPVESQIILAADEVQALSGPEPKPEPELEPSKQENQAKEEKPNMAITEPVEAEPVATQAASASQPVLTEDTVDSSQTNPPQPAVKTKPTSPTKMVGTSYSLHEKNLLSRDPSHYTLQLMGAHDKSPLTKFVSKAHLNDAWYFHTWHDHKHWYVVVYGDYASHQDAEHAIKQLPESVLQQKPWVRSIASVQSAISKNEKIG